VLLEWSFQQLKVAGSIDRLLKYANSAFRASSEAALNCAQRREVVHAENVDVLTVKGQPEV